MKNFPTPVILLSFLAFGCPQELEPDAVEVRFELTNGNPSFADFLDVPWPSDYHRQDNNPNSVDLRAFPNPTSSSLLDVYLETFQLYGKGYSGIGSQYFLIPGGVDSASMPQTAQESLSSDASVFLVEVERPSTRIPIQIKAYENTFDFVARGTVAVRPMLGLHTLKQTALVVTNRVKAADGAPVKASEHMQRVMNCETVETTLNLPDCKLYQEVLDGIGLSANDVALISLFTPQDPIADFMVATEQMIQDYEPQVRNVEFMLESWQTGNYYAYKGEIRLESYQRGSPPYTDRDRFDGEFVYDDDGTFVLQREDWVPFTLTVPKLDMPASGWPIAVYGHGTGGDRLSPLGKSNRYESFLLAQAGWALMTVAEPLHKSREGYQQDNEEINTFNFFNPWSSRDTWLMSALEKIQQVSAVENLEVPAIDDAPEAFFDTEKIGYMGHSQGGIVGAILAPLDPRIKGLFLSGAGAGFTDSLTGKFEPVDIPGVLMMALDLDDLEELDVFHPLMTLLQGWVDRLDPIHFGHHWFDGSGFAQPHLLTTSGLEDKYTPVPTHHGLAGGFRLPLVEPVAEVFPVIDLLGLAGQEPPLTANLELGNGVKRTAGMVQYPLDGHFAIYNNTGAQDLIYNFFQTLATAEDPSIDLR